MSCISKITTETRAGCQIFTVVQELVKLRDEYHCEVETDFNGDRLFCRDSMTAEEVCDDWQKRRNERQKEEENKIHFSQETQRILALIREHTKHNLPYHPLSVDLRDKKFLLDLVDALVTNLKRHGGI